MSFVICASRWLPSPTGMPSGHVAHSASSLVSAMEAVVRGLGSVPSAEDGGHPGVEYDLPFA